MNLHTEVRGIINNFDTEDLLYYVWTSTDGFERIICDLEGWLPAPGKHGTDAIAPDGSHIEIKSSTYTGTVSSKGKITSLAGKFTIGMLTMDIAERLRKEEIHIYGKVDETLSLPYHIKISGAELYPILVDYINDPKSNPNFHATYNLYKDFKSLEIVKYDHDFITANREKFSDGFIYFLMGGRVVFENQFHRIELPECVEIIDVFYTGAKRKVVNFTYHHSVFDMTVTRSAKSVDKSGLDWDKMYAKTYKDTMFKTLFNLNVPNAVVAMQINMGLEAILDTEAYNVNVKNIGKKRSYMVKKGQL